MTNHKSAAPPVEQLSDVAWARVERNVLTRATGTITHAAAARDVGPERRSTWLWLAVPVAAAAAFALAFFSVNGSDNGPTASSDEEPSRIVAGGSPSTMSFGDAHITLAANTAVVVDQKAGRPTALVEYGGAVFAVAPRADRAPFTVLAADARIHTTGSNVRVDRVGERVSVVVENGSVTIRFQGRDVILLANHGWSSDRPDQVTAVAADHDDIQIELHGPPAPPNGE